ncbi:hypothetical protein HYFRA_00013626 [Hymenoscyphus fraxineus]|uniref:Uncharacterized protein n=1 Tax=Hymenoscyphus fraxineus TaxID=746836 RepID=A0A9N9L8I6_9HELO|nr:hypothetical protein HYFRA_00013626 [Hymenoscyphus fraxineus]
MGYRGSKSATGLNKPTSQIKPGAVKEQRVDATASKRDIDLKIIPFFKQYPIIGIKSLDLSDFSEVVDIVRVKQHLTEEGLAKILYSQYSLVI